MTTQETPPVEAVTPAGGFTPPREGQIFTLMSKVMAAVKGIAKSHRNQEQNYAFRSIDDAYNVVQPAMVEAGVFCTPRVMEYTAKPVTSSRGTEGTQILMRVAFEWCAPDGSSVTTIMLGQAIDYSDKAANKAMSAAYKYAMLETLCIPVAEGGEDRDADYNTPDAAPAAPPTGTVAPGNCPKCGKPMRKRSRKDGKGEFMGCTGYPTCKHTEKVPEEAKEPQEAKRDRTLAQEVWAKCLQLAVGDKVAAETTFFEIANTVLDRDCRVVKVEKDAELSMILGLLNERLNAAVEDDVLPF